MDGPGFAGCVGRARSARRFQFSRLNPVPHARCFSGLLVKRHRVLASSRIRAALNQTISKIRLRVGKSPKRLPNDFDTLYDQLSGTSTLYLLRLWHTREDR